MTLVKRTPVQFSTRAAVAAGLLLGACGDGGRSDSGLTGGSGSGGWSGDAGSDGNGSDGSSGGSGDDSGDVRFDLGNGGDSGPGEGGGDEGCQKVDFLFVVDNSGSMQDEQENLTRSFPGFIATIQNTLQARDFQIMVVDSDAFEGPGGGNSNNCSPAPQCCDAFCPNNPRGTCNGDSCWPDIPIPTGCDAELGAGRRTDPMGNDCGFTTNGRFMVDDQGNLADAFRCAAEVGTYGSPDERPMQAMVEAVTTKSQPGQCNEGFVRDDAILVVTFITDEAEGDSAGNAGSWRQDLIEVKQGVETSVVMLGLVGDTDLSSAICDPPSDLFGFTGADAAPMLRDFAESFSFGLWGSVCAPDYAPFFEEAVAVIDTACEDFVPPG